MLSAVNLKRFKMYKILRNRKILLCAALPDLALEDFNFQKYKEARGLYIVDPWERVKSIFSKDDYGNLHPELVSAIQMAQYGMLMGLLYGGIVEAKKEKERFFRTNDTNIYINLREAYQTLNNRTMLGTIKGAIKWCPTFALFSGTYSLISSCSELYRNKVDILDHIIAGASVGALYRFMFGVKGMITGGFFGGLIGTVYGTALWGISKLSKTEVLQIKYAQFAFSKYKKEQRRSLQEDKEDLEIIKSGLHVRHILNPLDMLEDKKEEEKNKKILKESKINK